MGGIFSRRRNKPSTEEILHNLQSKIDSLEELKKTDVERQRYLIGSLILYSIVLYVIAALVFYFYYLPERILERIKYASPLAAFPVLVLFVKRFLHWYFVKRISKNRAALERLKEEKTKILDEVMETETYKKAKEILEKYDPEMLHDTEFSPSKAQRTPEGQELRQRNVPQGRTMAPVPSTVTAMTSPTGQPGSGQQIVRPPMPKPAQIPNTNHQMLKAPGGVPLARPTLPRPLLPRERSIADRFVDYLLGDGPQNRYALICKDCHLHNGMALKEEFEYFSFRCCYCNSWNPARKQRPSPPSRIGQQPKVIPDKDHNVNQPNAAGEVMKKLANRTTDEQPEENRTQQDGC